MKLRFKDLIYLIKMPKYARKIKRNRKVYRKVYRPYKRVPKIYPERKFQTSLTATPLGIDWNGSVNVCCLPTQGTNINNRIGNSIQLRNMLVRMTMKNVSTTNANIRFIVFLDTMNTGTAPTMNDVLSNVGSAQAHLSSLNTASLSRFRILKDHHFTLFPAGQDTSERFYKFWLKLRNVISKFNSSGQYKNALYWGIISDINPVATLPQLSHNTRAYYIDV